MPFEFRSQKILGVLQGRLKETKILRVKPKKIVWKHRLE